MTQVIRDRLYRRHRFPAEVIAHAVWLYLRFSLSLRMVEDLLAARGIIVSHQTVRLWVGDPPVGSMKNGTSMMFKDRHFELSVIILRVRWYLTYGLSLRDLKEMMAERGITVDHSTIHRWVVH